jgi:phage terminase large subunit GpA-like protein
MDCGAQVDWAARLDDPQNLSAVQATMHAVYKFGLAGFAAEFQNEPLTGEPGTVRLTAAACAARFNGRPWAEIPLACTELTMGIDVQQSSLWYVVIAWEPNFTGYVVDYGVWPRQNRQVFTLADVVDSPNNLAVKFKGRGVEGAIQAGLEELVEASFVRDFTRAGGAGKMRIGRLMVDSGKWTGTIQAVKQKVGGALMLLSKGKGIKAGDSPMSSRKRKEGERPPGDHCYMPSTKGTREFPYVMIDTNHWKSFVHGALLTAPGDPGALTLFGDNATQHALFASHITAETYKTPKSEQGIPVSEWTLRPQRPDNHWLDATVICAVAASYFQGIKSPDQAAAPRQGGPRKVRMSYAEIMARNQGAKT